MKIGREGTTTTVIGDVGEVQEFKLNNSSIAFDILSSRLYNDKIQAIIRELSCNAYDAHVAAGKVDVPFSIHLPTSFEPYFSITDYGTGLSHENVINLYCTYFASSKNNSNEFIGAMGLGSKSPFCYTGSDDQSVGFTVVSRHNGWIRTYDAHLGSNGLPEVVLMNEEEDPSAVNGLEISFPVVKEDFVEFRNKAAIALEFFDPKPEINLSDFSTKKTEYVVKSKRWGVRKNAYTTQSYDVRAVMGKVAYSIGNIDTSKMNNLQKKLLTMPIDIFFEIGELTPAASRETLSNTKATIDAILNAVQGIYKDLIDEIKAKINLCHTAWGARLEIMDLKNSTLGPVVEAALQEKILLGQYMNFSLNDQGFRINQFNYDWVNLISFKYNNTAVHHARKTQLFLSRVKRVGGLSPFEVTRNQIRERAEKREYYSFELNIEGGVLFVINDLSEGTERYINYLIQKGQVLPNSNEKIKKVYLLTPATKIYHKTEFDKECERILVALGNPPNIMASALKVAFPQADPVKTSNYIKREKKQVMILNMFASSYDKMWMKADNADLIDGEKIYVVVKENKPQFLTWGNAAAFTEFIRKMEGAELISILYGLRPTSKLIGKSGWVELSEYLKNITDKLLKPDNFKKMTELMRETFLPHMEMWPKLAVSSNNHSPAVKFAKLVVECSSYSGDSNIREVLETLKRKNVIKYDIFTLPDLMKEYKKVAKIYPLLVTGDDRWVNEYIKYIELIDAANNRKDDHDGASFGVAPVDEHPSILVN